jgi:hypothetical protein
MELTEALLTDLEPILPTNLCFSAICLLDLWRVNFFYRLMFEHVVLILIPFSHLNVITKLMSSLNLASFTSSASFPLLLLLIGFTVKSAIFNETDMSTLNQFID